MQLPFLATLALSRAVTEQFLPSRAALDETHRESAAWIRSLIVNNTVTRAEFRSALIGVQPGLRDAWLDLVLGTEEIPEDGPDLPTGCVPYLPCAVDTLLQMIEHAGVHSRDVFVDVGSGLGRAAILTQLLTGAAAIGIEIQAHLVSASRDKTARLNVSRFSVVHGDAVRLTGFIPIGSVFFFYCPFSGDRLEKVLDDLEPIARTRPIRICCVDVALPSRPWLTLVSPPCGDLAIYRSTLLDAD